MNKTASYITKIKTLFVDVLVLNDIIDQAAGRSNRPSHTSGVEEEAEPANLKALIKAKLIEGCFRFIGRLIYES